MSASPRHAALLSFLVACFCASGSWAAITGGPKVAPRKADTKFIKCAVCERMARSAYDQAQALLATSKSTGIKVDEAAVIDLVERSIVSWKEEGDWMTRLHLQVASGGALAVRDMRQPGECGEACKTIERAAEEVMGEHDTDVAEALFTGKRSFDAFKKWMCHELTRACAAAAPSVPTGHAPYPPFQPRAAGAQNVDRMVGEMAEKGLSGRMYSREDLLDKYMGELGQEEEDEEDADEGEAMPGLAAGDAEGRRKVNEAAEEARKLWDEFQEGEGDGAAAAQVPDEL